MRPFFLLLVPALAWSAILPETIGHWKRGEPTAAVTPDPAIWAEYGLKEAETSPYSDAGTKYAISAWRFADATGAMAAFDDLVPAGAGKSTLMGISAETDADAYVAAGNYLFWFQGYKIHGDELSHVVATVPKYEHSPLPTLPTYLPAGARPYSLRYIMGPASLERFAPSIGSAVVAFHFNAEGEVAKYGQPGKETTLVIFNYPSMEMARDRLAHFQAVPGAVCKRTGPMVAVVMNPTRADDAEKLLSRVKYEAAVTMPEHLPNHADNAGTLFLNAFLLCGILFGLCIVAGIVVGGLRTIIRRSGPAGDGESMISLHLSNRS